MLKRASIVHTFERYNVKRCFAFALRRELNAFVVRS
jgi:hypothetical protein